MSGSGPSEERKSTGQGNGRNPVTGQFTSGNIFALRHGRRSTVVRRRIEEESRAELAERRQAILNDLGGLDQLSTIATDVVERYLVAAALLGWMEDRLIVDGVLTTRGQRRAVHHAYLAQLNQCVKLAGMLGLKRRPARVQTLEEVLSGGVASATETAEPAGEAPTPRPCPVRLPGVIPDAELHGGAP